MKNIMEKFNYHMKGWKNTLYFMLFIAFIPNLYISYIEYQNVKKPASEIWTYASIEANWEQIVWKEPSFASERVSYDWPFLMTFAEKIVCWNDLYKADTTLPFPFKLLDTRDDARTFWFWGEGYVYHKEAQGCKFVSCQFLDYYGFAKSQCFESKIDFDILPSEKWEIIQ